MAVPPGVVTVTSTVPGRGAGVVAVIVVSVIDGEAVAGGGAEGDRGGADEVGAGDGHGGATRLGPVVGVTRW